MRRISFPDYAHKSSIPVQMYLNGEIGSLEEVNVYAASTFYSIDRVYLLPDRLEPGL